MGDAAKPRWASVPLGLDGIHVVPIWEIPGDDDWMTLHEVSNCWCCPRMGDDGIVVHHDRAERH